MILTEVQKKMLEIYFHEEVDSAQWAEELGFKKVDNKKVHAFLSFAAEVYVEVDGLEDNVIIFGSIKDAEKIIYYVGGENSAELQMYYDEMAIYSGIGSRFEPKLEE